jgi:O-antigen/teichoic acid export membrane protein
MNSTKQRVFKNVNAYILVNLLPLISSFFTLPIYSRYMDPSSYGILALVSAFTALLGPVVSMQLSGAFSRYYHDLSEEEIKVFFSTIFYSVFFITLSFILLVHLNGQTIIAFMFPKAQIKYMPYFFVSLLWLLFQQTGSVIGGLIIVQERGGLALVRAAFGTFIGISLGMFFVVHLKMGVLGALIGSACANFVILLLNIVLVRSYFVMTWNYSYFKKSVIYSWPIIFHAISGYLFMYSDRVVMEKFVPLSVIGLYSIADRIASILKMIVNSINQAILPNFIRQSKDSERLTKEKYRKIIVKWSVIVSSLYLAMAFFSEEVIIILTPAAYHSAYLLVPILLIAYIFRGLYTFAVSPLFYHKKTKKLPIITASAGIVNIVLNLLTIKYYGAYAVAFTTVLSFMITFALAHYFSIKNNYYLHFEWGTLTKIFIPVFIVSGASYLLLELPFGLKILIKIMLLLLYLAYLWLMNYGDIKQDIKELLTTIQNTIQRG